MHELASRQGSGFEVIILHLQGVARCVCAERANFLPRLSLELLLSSCLPALHPLILSRTNHCQTLTFHV